VGGGRISRRSSKEGSRGKRGAKESARRRYVPSPTVSVEALAICCVCLACMNVRCRILHVLLDIT
jgi:hypothetical protein